MPRAEKIVEPTVTLPEPEEGFDYFLLPTIEPGREYASLAREYTHNVVIEDDGVNEVFTCRPSALCDEARDNAFGVGYGRQIYPGTIGPMKGGTRLDAVNRKQKNFLSEEFVSNTGGGTPFEVEGKKHISRFVKDHIATVKTKKASEEWYAVNGNTPETVLRVVCDTVAARMDGADAQVLFDRNWPKKKAEIDAMVAVVVSAAKAKREINKKSTGLDLSIMS